MNITVVLCTYNRCQSLAIALDSLVAQVLPEAVEWEILVVDNNSTDRTREVVQDYSRRNPGRVRYIFEARQGLSHARNTGVREAHGDILAFTDDDVTVGPTWLASLTSVLHKDEWVGTGGRIVPVWGCAPPRWLPTKGRHALGPLVVFDLGPEPRQLAEAPFGANMAFRHQVFQKHGNFRSDLGRCGGNLLSGEDTEFGDRLLAQGERLRYEPLAVVYHPVLESRLQKKYFLAWWFDKGRSEVRAFGAPPACRWYIAGIPLVLVRRMVVGVVRWFVALKPWQRFDCRCKVRYTAGQIVECHRQSRVARSADRVTIHTKLGPFEPKFRDLKERE